MVSRKPTTSLWDEGMWKKMSQESSKIPTTLEEALRAGYLDEGGDDSTSFCGGILGHEFIQGTFLLTNEHLRLPELLLPWRARLEFGKPYVKEQPTEKTKSK